MIELKISLELTKNGIQKSVHAKEGESESRKLIITLTESGKVYNVKNMSARVYYEDGTYSDAEIPESGNVVEFVLPSGLVSAEGVRICELQIRKGTACIYSPMFELIVEKSFGATATEDIFVGETERYQPLISSKSEMKTDVMGTVDCFAVLDSVKDKIVLVPWFKFWEQHCIDGLHSIAMIGGLREALDSKASAQTVINHYNEFNQAFSVRDKNLNEYAARADNQILKLQEAKHTHENEAVIDKFSAPEGKLLFDGKPIEGESSSGTGLPDVSEEDNGKFLLVENGAWAAVAVPSAEEAVF